MRDRIEHLINNLTERLDVEVKNWLNGLQTNDDKAKLAKEIIALANSGGGDIFIGFDDKGVGHPEVPHRPGELEAFSQDSIADLVHKYATPPFQCRIEFRRREGCEVAHPVITVPGDHRTPVMAKRGSPDGNALRQGTVYVRRPGGHSEPARTQDDWEKLLDRLVRARGNEMLDAIRAVLNPPGNVAVADTGLESWDRESRELWQDRIEQLQANDPRRLEHGHWTISFAISPFSEPSIGELNKALEREMPAHSGWPPFTYLHREPKRPKPAGESIIAWLVNPEDPPAGYPDNIDADFWRVARSGHGFLLRDYEEDSVHYARRLETRRHQARRQQTSGSQRHFDWILPIYRMTEILKFVEALADRFGEPQAMCRILLRYYGMNNRTLSRRKLSYPPPPVGTCMQSIVESRMECAVSELGPLLPERVHALLAPVYLQFDFAELPQALVNDRVSR